MYTNKLIDEKSPYLLQHAHNPVDWHPWGEDAFAKARKENKPIFLSVGYSTCHWCHVMERESFESEEVAELLNRAFVPVKVDREERPDVDRVYMTFVQAATGGGGWPMSVWLTPDLKPFYGGTYYPPESVHGRPGFKMVLERLAQAWAADEAKILESSERVIQQLEERLAGESRGAAVDETVFESAFQQFRGLFDTKLGGFGGPPKFPRPVTHNFLLRYHAETGNTEAVDMVVKTLHEMSGGGMYDQLGGGFHRYSVDERWFVPHFEKMLYDQAQLAVSCLEAYQVTKDESLAEIARGIFRYVLRDMRHPDGGFYSAEDADSVIDASKPREKGEGAFYIFSGEEIAEAAGENEAEWFRYRYGVLPKGNVQHDPQGEFQGKNILYQARSVEETAKHFGAAEEEVRKALQQVGEKLMAARDTRVRPHLDDKVLTSWNALMISAFSLGAQVLEEPEYLNAARRAADFLLKRMYDEETGSLLRRFRDGDAAIAGFLDDYSCLILALLDLYETCFDVRYLETAIHLAEKELELFEDTGEGGFYSTAAGDRNLVMRLKDDYDGAEPSGNSMAVLGLLRLAEFTNRDEFRAAADRALRSFGAKLAEAPVTAPQMLVAAMYARDEPKQIVVAGELDAGARELLREVWSRFVPAKTIALADGKSAGRLTSLVPAIEERKPVDGKAAAYVCENYTCQLPVTDREGLIELLQ